MSAFDKIIGYETIKNEFVQLCDMVHNKSIYEKLGAKQPQGILLYGNPGLGKTLMANCFIEESGLKSYTVRRNKCANDFVSEIANTFKAAKENAPAIVFLDDLDKYANEDERRRDTQEYVAVQAGIDDIQNCDVFIIATANNIEKLPYSLTRSGRFDRKIEVCIPTAKDAEEIIKHYLQDKKVSPDVSLEDIAMMINYSSCAELETILNEAAINAAFARRPSISMDDLTNAVLRMQYHSPDNFSKPSEKDLQKTALHEAGHLVVCEVLCPGSVGLASLRSRGRDFADGFIRICRELIRRPHRILVALGGKAAVELYHCETCANCCQSDIERAVREIRNGISQSGTCGLGLIHVATHQMPRVSENMNTKTEAVVHAELERYMFKARNILLKNMTFLKKAAALLLEKETLLYSDIRALRESVTIVRVPV